MVHAVCRRRGCATVINIKEINSPYALGPSFLAMYILKRTVRIALIIEVKEIRITGPSSKFPNQRVGLSHILKDKDIIEFHTL